MTVSIRYRQPWSSNEVNRLYSEYELRQLPILDIATLHKRGEHAILHRLAKEGLILESWADVRGWNDKPAATVKPTVYFKPTCPCVNTVFFSQDSDDDDVESLEDNDDPNDGDYIYESDEDDEDDLSDSEEEDNVNDSDRDYEEEVESVESDSDYEDEADAKDEDYDPYSIKQKAKFIHNIIGALKFFVYAA
jgi:hypothetical protein